ncbi:MAG: hypothetical protein LUE27_05385 [Clostridia bacterium]|nr:hypothetical protein [Clostridia bacterium]
MKKYITILSIFMALAFTGRAQTTDIPLRVVVSEDSGVPAEAAEYLQNKLMYLVTGYNTGATGSEASQFCISARTLVESKEVVGSAPAVYTLSLNIILYVADWVNDKLFTRVSFSVKGAGQSEAKAYINAFKRINPSDKEIQSFLEEARSSIISYYNSEGPAIIQSARTLAVAGQYEKALFTLASIPSACTSLYSQANGDILEIYGSYADYDGGAKLTEARDIWSGSKNHEGAVRACALLSQIAPCSTSYADASNLSAEIQNQEGQISEMRVYSDTSDIGEQKLEAARQIGFAFGNRQQPSISAATRRAGSEYGKVGDSIFDR